MQVPINDLREKDVFDEEVCPECGALLEGIWDNSGWDDIEGPKNEVCIGVKCTECNYKNE